VSAGTIVCVDDQAEVRRLLGDVFRARGREVASFDDGEDAIAWLRTHSADAEMAVLDLDLGRGKRTGIEICKEIRTRHPDLPIIILTGHGTIDDAVAAVKAGAVDFITKDPYLEDKLEIGVEKVERMLRHVEERKRLEDENRELRATNERLRRIAGRRWQIVGDSAPMRAVMAKIERVAPVPRPVLVLGPRGTGKELVARAIQGSSDRKSKSFVTVNCGAIPDNLVESILFGHEKGAFTGATEKHAGKFVEANGGTLFLDEIGDLPLEVQVKLLRAVQDGEIETVGGRGSQKVDIRLISATHRNLLQRVKDGQFREDLFYRLNVFPIFVPPLRDRRDDIPALVAHFIRQISLKEHRGKVSGISPRALAMLSAYDWPGNIRQLENAVFRAVVLADGDILTPDDFPQIRVEVDGIDFEQIAVEMPPSTVIPGHAPPVPARTDATESGLSGRFGIVRALDDGGNVRTLADVELEMILLAIEHYRGQMSEVARRLGIGRSTLYRKLKEHGIDPDEGRPPTGSLAL
jgi:DNA-binding NtrC family response regulator